MFRRQGVFYYENGYSVRSNSPRKYWSDSVNEYINRMIARIGRDRPIYYSEYIELFERIARKLVDPQGLGCVLRAAHSRIDSYGRFRLIKNWPRFEADYIRWDEPEGPFTDLRDVYKCEGCGKMRQKSVDPPKMEYGFDEYQFRYGHRAIAIECCKKCRAEIRRITRVTRELKENRTLINKLKREIQNVCNQNNG